MSDSVKLQFLGQVGYLIRCGGLAVVIDPYLSDSAAAGDARFTRLFPPPISPEALRADIYIVTHDHLDHLDPDTIAAYAHKRTTTFVAPRFASHKLAKLGVPEANIRVVDHGGELSLPGLTVRGVFALGTSCDTIDTCGYLLTFPAGQTLYHTADTSYCPLLLDCAPHADVLLVCINGKFGNLNIQEAAALTRKVAPRYVLPNHFDMMALNSENPHAFAYALEVAAIPGECVILKAGEQFSWQ